MEKNRLFYKKAEQIIDGCSCDGCCNYFVATEDFPREVKEFFDQLGVDLNKATEIITWGSENDVKSLYYGGFYHLCGKVLEGEDCWERDGRLNTDGMYSVAEGYSIGFSRQIALLEKDFPEPIIQMEIDFHNVPWVLDKKNTYR